MLGVFLVFILMFMKDLTYLKACDRYLYNFKPTVFCIQHFWFSIFSEMKTVAYLFESKPLFSVSIILVQDFFCYGVCVAICVCIFI